MNGLTREFAEAEVIVSEGFESTDGEVDRVGIIAGGAVIRDRDGD